MENVINYVAPEVEVLDIEVEKGFQTSLEDPNLNGGNDFGKQ